MHNISNVPIHSISIYCKKGGRGKTGQKEGSGRQRSRKRENLYDASQTYLNHFSTLLDAELKAEQLEIAEQRNHFNRNGKRPSNGFFFAKPFRRVFRNEVYDFFQLKQTSNNTQMTTKYTKGDIVEVIDSKGKMDVQVEGVVMLATSQLLRVAFIMGTDSAQRVDNMATRKVPVLLQRGANTISFQRAEEALKRFTQVAKASEISRLIMMSFVDFTARSRDLELHRYRWYDGIVESTQIISNSSNANWDEVCSAKAVPIRPEEMKTVLTSSNAKKLNKSQQKAVEMALRNRITLIQGPPGTGKTLTASYLIAAAITLGIRPILACAASNTASDNFMRKIIEVCRPKTRIVRVGRPAAIQEDLWEKTLDGLLEEDKTVRKAREDFANGFSKLPDLIQTEKEAIARILKNADVIVTTCIGSGSEDMQQMLFSYVIVDEATQATEPDTLVAITAGRQMAKQIVLVGDQNQLPPTVLCKDINENVGFGLEVSLFVRLWLTGVRTQLLNMQYRMHPVLAQFPSQLFYAGRLLNGISEKDRELPRGWDTENVLLSVAHRVWFFPVADGMEKKASSNDTIIRASSYLNHEEAAVVTAIVKYLCNKEHTHRANTRPFVGSDIGIISPYSAQVRLLRDKLSEECSMIDLSVNSVDGFQGREKEVIIISSVRNNEDGRVGFLNDWRRLNVAITRARRLLILVGNECTLESSPHWREWLQWIRSRASTIPCTKYEDILFDVNASMGPTTTQEEQNG